MLTSKEEKVIKLFKEKIKNQFKDAILQVIVFGSKVKGDATENSDIDILVVTSLEDWRECDRIREIGYELDEEIDYRLSIQVIPKFHIDYLRKNNFQFIRNIENDGVII